MARKKKKKKGDFWSRCADRWHRMSKESKHRTVLVTGKAMILLVLCAAAAYGLFRLEQSVFASPSFNEPPIIQLVDPPSDLEGVIMEQLAGFDNRAWSDRSLPKDIAAALADIAWVEEVKEVRRASNHIIEVYCTYRTPLAMVQADGSFFLVDEHGVRLPGRYNYHPAMKIVQGVRTRPPAPGKVWDSPDLTAGLDLVEILLKEEFAYQITAVLVQNYAGRLDDRAAQIELATDRTGRRIVWGSPPGQELEENSVDQKIAILRANFERFGHIDADRELIDISILPDRMHSPA